MRTMAPLSVAFLSPLEELPSAGPGVPGLPILVLVLGLPRLSLLSPLSHILPQSSHLTARLNVTPAQVGSENCYLVNIQRSVAMFAGRLTRYFLFTIQPSLITVTKISVLGYYDNSDFLLSKYRSVA